MLKQPLIKIDRSMLTVLIMWFSMFTTYFLLTFMCFPFYKDQEIMILICITLFLMTFGAHMALLFKDPGHV